MRPPSEFPSAHPPNRAWVIEVVDLDAYGRGGQEHIRHRRCLTDHLPIDLHNAKGWITGLHSQHRDPRRRDMRTRTFGHARPVPHGARQYARPRHPQIGCYHPAAPRHPWSLGAGPSAWDAPRSSAPTELPAATVMPSKGLQCRPPRDEGTAQRTVTGYLSVVGQQPPAAAAPARPGFRPRTRRASTQARNVRWLCGHRCRFGGVGRRCG